MTRWLALFLACVAAFSPAALAGSIDDPPRDDAECCCRSDVSAPVLRAAGARCCCAPKPAPLPHECVDWALPNSASAAEFSPPTRVLVDCLPRAARVSRRVLTAVPSRAPPVRELLGVWLL